MGKGTCTPCRSGHYTFQVNADHCKVCDNPMDARSGVFHSFDYFVSNQQCASDTLAPNILSNSPLIVSQLDPNEEVPKRQWSPRVIGLLISSITLLSISALAIIGYIYISKKALAYHVLEKSKKQGPTVNTVTNESHGTFRTESLNESVEPPSPDTVIRSRHSVIDMKSPQMGRGEQEMTTIQDSRNTDANESLEGGEGNSEQQDQFVFTSRLEQKQGSDEEADFTETE